MPAFQSANDLTQQFRTLMHTRPWFVPKNLKNFQHSRIALQQNHNAFGMPYDPDCAEGQIVHVSDTMIVLKKLPSEYVVLDPALLPPGYHFALRERVSLTPYARKSLDDFQRLDAPRSNGRGFMVKTMGSVDTHIPGTPQHDYLQQLKHQLEHLKMPDGYRTISNALADWHAQNFDWIADDRALDYRLCFDTTAPGFTGRVTLQYNRVPDDYSVITQAHTEQRCYFDDLGEALATIANDADNWFRIVVSSHSAVRKAA
jgi:hypothetical protein